MTDIFRVMAKPVKLPVGKVKMDKTELLRRMDLMADFYFLIEERGYTRKEAAQAVGLDFDPKQMDNMVFEVSSTGDKADEDSKS